MAYFLDGQGLFKPKLHIGSMDNVKISSLDEKIGTVIQKKYPSQDSVSFAKDVHLFGTQYVKGIDPVCWSMQWPTRVLQDTEHFGGL